MELLRIIILISIFESLYSRQIYIRYQQEVNMVHQYFHGIESEYYVDLGSFDSAFISNPTTLTSWRGLRIEASQSRFKNTFFQLPDHTVLNFAMSNVSGHTVTFYENNAAPDISTLRSDRIMGPGKKSLVTTINMADLCHKYYLKRPKFMSIGVEGVEYIALASNDWNTTKCIPEMIYVNSAPKYYKDDPNIITDYLLARDYQMFPQKHNSKHIIAIHKDSVDELRENYIKGKKYIKNVQKVYWSSICSQFRFKLAPAINVPGSFQQQITPKDPLFFHFKKERVVSIPAITDYSNMVYPQKKYRPIVIFSFDQEFSKIFLGTNLFTKTNKQFSPSMKYAEINAQYQTYNQTIYIFDHQRYSSLQPIILDDGHANTNPTVTQPPIVSSSSLPGSRVTSNNQQLNQIKKMISDSFTKKQNAKIELMTKKINTLYNLAIFGIICIFIIMISIFLYKKKENLQMKQKQIVILKGQQSDVLQ